MKRVGPAAERRDTRPLEELVLAVGQERDRDAFAALFLHFAPRVKAYLMRLGSETAAAEELMQEAMISVWRHAARFDPRQASASTWIFTIARNKRIDAQRRTRRPELDPEDPALVPAAPDSPELLVGGAELAARVRSALDQLSPEQASLVRLAYFEDRSQSLLSAEQNLPLGTVKSRLRLALAHLRKLLQEVQ